MTVEDPLRNLKMLTSLCGQATMPHIALSTTMWSEVPPETGARQEKAFAHYWTKLSSKECHIEPFGDSFDSAWAIIGELDRKGSVVLSSELVTEVEEDLRMFLMGQQGLIKKLEEQADRQKDPELMGELQRKKAELAGGPRAILSNILQKRRRGTLISPSLLSEEQVVREKVLRAPGNDIFIVCVKSMISNSSCSPISLVL